MKKTKIIGAGLAGCEAALQLSEAGFEVVLVDAKPVVKLSVYRLNTFCELVCNNSLGNINVRKPLGLLLSELKFLNCKLIDLAKSCLVDDKKTISVDKINFSQKVTTALINSGVCIKSEVVEEVPDDETLIIASGPLTNESLAKDISNKFKISKYNFFDASCPIIARNSIDFSDEHLYKINDDLSIIEIPDSNFEKFFSLLKKYIGDNSNLPDNKINFDKCFTIEKLAMFGKEILISKRFSNYKSSYPIIVLRREAALNDAFILVGCITAMKHKHQSEVFSLIPALRNCKFLRYGRQHRNTFFHAPGSLDNFFRIKNNKRDIFLIGQISGLDGYAPAISSGYISALRIIVGNKLLPLPRETMIGEMARYISDENVVDFQPTCATFSLFKNYNPEMAEKHSFQLLSEYINKISKTKI